ncbi:MAG: helix-turn-helix transcriptional regulator [Planctomycetes bacterium]|nr:helix-turn-helix transcriptional regulator [Planctomycetota bacterium]
MLIEKLRAAMAQVNMTNVALARALGTQPETISRVFSGQRRFSNGHDVKVMDLFPELNTYCYAHMAESGKRQNARRESVA